MSQKLLTISMASYNAEEYISEAIDSVLLNEKVAEKIQVVVVNDGSKDKTKEIALNYQTKYKDSVVLVDKKNEGFGSTINSGIQEASGKYFMLLDADDWAISKNLEYLIDVLEKSNSDLIVAPYIIKYMQDGHCTQIDSHSGLSEEIVEINRADIKTPLRMHELFIKTDLLKNFHIEVGNGFYTDSELSFKAFIRAKTIQRFKEPIYLYRVGREGQSISVESTRKHIQDKIDLAERMKTDYLSLRNAISSDNAIAIIEKDLSDNISGVYAAYMIQNRPLMYKSMLIQYDQKLREEDERLYKITDRVKKIRLVRGMKFRFYVLLCFFVKATMRNKI